MYSSFRKLIILAVYVISLVSFSLIQDGRNITWYSLVHIGLVQNRRNVLFYRYSEI